MSKAPHRYRAGFTLVELLIGTTLAGIVMAAVLSNYVYLGRSFARLANQQTLESEARRTLAYFSKDVHAATGISGTPSATTVALTVPTAAGTKTITYYYNSTAISGSTTSDNVTVNGATVAMQREALTRCVYNGTTVTSLLLLRYITDNDGSTTPDLTIRYYDNSNNEYASATLSAGSYLSGIKQLSIEFSTQTGVGPTGTQTPVYRMASARLLIHNSALLQ